LRFEEKLSSSWIWTNILYPILSFTEQARGGEITIIIICLKACMASLAHVFSLVSYRIVSYSRSIWEFIKLCLHNYLSRGELSVTAWGITKILSLVGVIGGYPQIY